MDLKDRYNREHTYGNVRFFLSDYTPLPEQCRYLMLKVLEQAIRDYCALGESELSNERIYWETARTFIFENHYISWGKWELNIEEFLDILDIDLVWFREQVIRKFKARHGGKDGQSSGRNFRGKAKESNSARTRRNKKRTW